MTHLPDTIFRALGDPTRRSLFEQLCANGELTVRALTDGAGISQPAVSKHLRVLKEAGLVTDRPAGRETHYSADLKGLAPLVGWIGRYAAFWEERIDALEDLLKRMDQ
ncbi:MAG: metalloregulator ArsR/SmtB family transcription factor [Hyphomonadaceae bacterium]